MEFQQRINEALTRRRVAGLLRELRAAEPLGGVRVSLGGRALVSFCSNDYLGLAGHPKLTHASAAALEQGVGSGASALITGHSALHQRAAAELAAWKGYESALLLPSGYQANLAAVQTLAAIVGGKVRFLVDKLAHASLLDAVMPHRFRVFPHNDMGKLRRLLEGADANEMQVVVTESIFSMDGDECDAAGLLELKRRHGFVLLLDEAHATGVVGPGGRGLASMPPLRGEVDVAVVTLSKALGAQGGAVCGSGSFIAAAVNFARAYVYSTSVSPVIPACLSAALGVLAGEPWRVERLQQNAARLRAGLGLSPLRSAIVPVLMGEPEAAVAMQQRLLDAGYLVVAVRPPTVPQGQSRLRVTLSAEHTDHQIDGLVDALRKAGLTGPTPR